MAYTKKIWEDFPNTSTPITADDLNNIEDGIEALDTGINLKSNLISARPDGNFTLTAANAYVKIPIPQLVAAVGDKLTISDGEILVGSGVSKIKVSAVTTMVIAASGTKYLELRKNNTQFFAAYSTTGAAGNTVNLSISNFIISVVEGDKISLNGRGLSGDIYNRYQTNLTVEVVE